MLYNISYIFQKGAKMPPKAKITKEMIIEEAFQIAREQGADKITARSISQQLSCSTQPVLYYFSSVEDIKKAVCQKADEYHTNYLTRLDPTSDSPMLDIGINYIRFAIEEKNLFRFLFQNNEFSGAAMSDLIDAEELSPILLVLQQTLNISRGEAKEIFSTLFIFVHGYASLFANNSMVYDEELLKTTLTKVFYGIVHTIKEDPNEKDL